MLGACTHTKTSIASTHPMRTLGGFAGLSCMAPELTDAISARRADEDLEKMLAGDASGAKSTQLRARTLWIMRNHVAYTSSQILKRPDTLPFGVRLY